MHWESDRILTMPHHERQTWCEEVSKLNRRTSESADR
ncbi:MAG: DUF6760 family protein [Chthoniobacter sp.]